MKRNNRPPPGPTTAANLEARFDAGQDVLDYFDVSKAVRGDLSPQPMQVELPAWAVSALDREADRRGVAPQSLVKSAVVEWLGVQAKKLRGRGSNHSMVRLSDWIIGPPFRFSPSSGFASSRAAERWHFWKCPSADAPQWL